MASSEKEQNQPAPPKTRPVTQQGSGDDRRSIIDSSELVGRDGTIQIMHSGEMYTLRVTRNNRLILTK